MLGVTGFGGVLPLMHRALVEKSAGYQNSALPNCWGCASFCRAEMP